MVTSSSACVCTHATRLSIPLPSSYLAHVILLSPAPLLSSLSLPPISSSFPSLPPSIRLYSLYPFVHNPGVNVLKRRNHPFSLSLSLSLSLSPTPNHLLFVLLPSSLPPSPSSLYLPLHPLHTLLLSTWLNVPEDATSSPSSCAIS